MTIAGSCHCGDNRFTIEAEIPDTLTRCTCSFCSKRGALVAYFAPEQFSPQPGTHDGVYRWNTGKVAHHFCNRCGISLYSDSPAFQKDGNWDGKTRRIGVNARLFEGFDAEAASIEVIDGRHLW